MSALQAVALLLVVVVAGTAIVFVPDPLRQALVLSLFGLALALLFVIGLYGVVSSPNLVRTVLSLTVVQCWAL